MAVVADIDVEPPIGAGPAVGAIGSQSEQQRLGRAPASLMLSTITVGRQSVGVSSTRERARARAGVVIPLGIHCRVVERTADIVAARSGLVESGLAGRIAALEKTHYVNGVNGRS